MMIRSNAEINMNKFRGIATLAAVLMVGAVWLGTPTQARADFTIRVTEFNSSGTEVTSAVQTVTSANAFIGNFGGQAEYSTTFVQPSLDHFSIAIVSDITNTGAGSTSVSTTINIGYNGQTGANSDTLLIEVLGTGFSSPSAGTPSYITDSNSGVSTTGLGANNVTATSGVLDSTVTTLNALTSGSSTVNGTILSGQQGQVSQTGGIGPGVASVLSSNPAVGSKFPIPNSFGFYQTYQFGDFTTTGTGGFTAGTTVSTPAPAAVVLGLTGVPVIALAGWLRRRKTILAS
jgi:hypothetical protein